MIVIYRFSDKGYSKNKPDYITKRGYHHSWTGQR